MNKLLALALLAMFFVGCPDPITTRTHIDDIVYVKDQKSNLCFALLGGDTIRPKGISIVPCEKVEHLINKEKQ